MMYWGAPLDQMWLLNFQKLYDVVIKIANIKNYVNLKCYIKTKIILLNTRDYLLYYILLLSTW